jgi:DNA helicase-2/ATP-dependent DNA helicase PcrA
MRIVRSIQVRSRVLKNKALSSIEELIKKIIPGKKLTPHEIKTKKLSEYAGEIITNLNLNTLTTTQNQLKNINQLMSTLIRFDNNPNGLKDFLAYLTYLEQNEFYDPQADKITLLTIHASKGLEFKNVYIIGCEDGLIPYIKKYEAEEEPNIEEEKRLLYVAMTRAKQNLTLIQTKTRTKQKTTTSRFLKDINTPPLTKIIDERIQKIETKIKKEKAKKSQLSLF